MNEKEKMKDKETQIEICENCKKRNNCNHRALIHKDGCKVNDCDCFNISTDKKQIEEMAKDIPFLTLHREVFVGATKERKVGWMLSEEDNKVIAKSLINQGYRKIPEGSVVLTSEEYEKLKNESIDKLFADDTFFKEEFKANEEYLRKRANRDYIKHIKKQTRKETAKEILQRISVIHTKNEGYTDWLDDSFYGDEFQNLCEEYGLKAIQTKDGVEVEE